MSRALPAIATRGKEFAVAHFPSAISLAEPVMLPARWTVLAEAAKAAGHIDWRLSPTIVLVDRRPS